MEISGDKTIELAKSAEKVSNNLGVEIVVAQPGIYVGRNK